jgi:peroxiredoxin
LSTAAHGVPSPAPDFVLKATDGRNLRLAEFRGDPVIVTFWGSWCGECRETLVALDAVSERTSTPVLGVNLDGSVERAASVATSLALHFPTLVDSKKSVARAYDVVRLPLTLLIDRHGAVRATWEGVAMPADDLARRLDALRQE